MPTFSVKSDIQPYYHTLSREVQKFIPRALVMGLNKTGMKVKTTVKNQIVQQASVKPSTVAGKSKSRGITLHRASQNRYTVVISVWERKGAPNLYGFQGVRMGRKMVIGRARRKGVRAKVFGKSKVYPGSFIGKTPVGRQPKLVWIRDAKKPDKVVPQQGAYAGRRIKRGPRKGQLIKRQPIRPVWGPRLPDFSQTDQAQDAVMQRIEAEFIPEFARGLQLVIDRASRRLDRRLAKG